MTAVFVTADSIASTLTK